MNIAELRFQYKNKSQAMQHTRFSLSSANVFGHLPILMTRHFKCKIALQLLEGAQCTRGYKHFL